jgi:tetratricopeptide (TPR) repeat protein
MSTTEFSWRRALIFFLAAFAVRAVFLAQWSHLPYTGSLCADAWTNNRWALDILDGALLRHTAFYQSPFYPYFLAAFYKVFGRDPHTVLWAQALIDSCTCVLIQRVTERCFGTRAGILAGLLAVLYRPFIFGVGLLTKETFVLFAGALFALMALRARAGGSVRDYLLCGLAAGWTVLLRTNMALLIPAALLWFWLSWGRARKDAMVFLRGAALPMLLGVMLPILPATLHNFAASHDLVLVNYTGGFTFFLGNNPEATGLETYPLGVSSDPLLEEGQSTHLAEVAAGRALKPSEASAYWFHQGLSFIADHPFRWLGLIGTKFWLFWNWYEISDNYDLQFVKKHFDTILKWPLVSFALVGSLGAAGLFLCRPGQLSGLPLFLFLAYLSSILPFLMSDRYRLPGVVFLIPLAAAALDRLAPAVRRMEWRNIRQLFLPALPLILLCLSRPPVNMKLDETAGWSQLVRVYYDLGDPQKALEAFSSAAALMPEAVDPLTIDKAALSLCRLGRFEEALDVYRTGSEIYPKSAVLYYGQATLLFQLGKISEGIGLFKRSLELKPGSGSEYLYLFHGYSSLGEKARAIKYGELAAARFPLDIELRHRLAKLKTSR